MDLTAGLEVAVIPRDVQGCPGIPQRNGRAVNCQTAGLRCMRSESRLRFIHSRSASTTVLPRQVGQVMNPLVPPMTPFALHLGQGLVSLADFGDS